MRFKPLNSINPTGNSCLPVHCRTKSEARQLLMHLAELGFDNVKSCASCIDDRFVRYGNDHVAYNVYVQQRFVTPAYIDVERCKKHFDLYIEFEDLLESPPTEEDIASEAFYSKVEALKSISNDLFNKYKRLYWNFENLSAEEAEEQKKNILAKLDRLSELISEYRNYLKDV